MSQDIASIIASLIICLIVVLPICGAAMMFGASHDQFIGALLILEPITFLCSLRRML